MKIYLLIIWSVLITSCTYRSDNISDKGEWVSVPVDSFAEGYNNIGGQIYWGYIVGDFTEEDNVGADIETFRVCKGSEYAKDKHHVYYPQVVICYEGFKEDKETGEYEGFGGEVAEKIVLKGAKPSQFKYIGNGYAVSGNKMFHDGEVIEWNDSIAKLNL
ncbi:MAG: hypothetical protein DBY35_03085 [Bacteroidales bacterium]|nr:MAG: hypothetical protein DBY35_03085 [Bacteroidales bacterium]